MNINKLTHQLIRGLLPDTGEYLNEIGEGTVKPYPSLKQHDDFEVEGDEIFGTVVYNFLTKDDHYYDVILSYYTTPEGENGVSIDFTADESYQTTDKGDLFKVMSTIVGILKKELQDSEKANLIDFITYIPAKQKVKTINTAGEIQRDQLYRAFIKKHIPNVVEKPGPANTVQFYLQETYKGKRTNNGAPGTLKAKITKLYGGDVTIEKAKKLKNREDATTLDKKQANWFINFHSKNEGIEQIPTVPETPSVNRKTNKIEVGDLEKITALDTPYPKAHKEDCGCMEKQTVEDQLIPYIVDLTKYMFNKGLKITPAPEIEFVEDEQNAEDTLGRTAYYDPINKLIVLYTVGRHPKDILRSFAHEMIHHNQNLEGRLQNITTQNINEDDYLKELEREAYEQGNLYLREWENSSKRQTTLDNS